MKQFVLKPGKGRVIYGNLSSHSKSSGNRNHDGTKAKPKSYFDWIGNFGFHVARKYEHASSLSFKAKIKNYIQDVVITNVITLIFIRIIAGCAKINVTF